MKKVRLTEKDIERLVNKIIKEEDFSRLTYDDMDFIDELYDEGMSAEDIAIEMDHKDYITVGMVKSYLEQNHDSLLGSDYRGWSARPDNPKGWDGEDNKLGMDEGRYDFDWDSVGDGSEDKYRQLEMDLSECIEPLIEKYKNDFGRDSYGVIDAIFQVLEGMFQKIR
jgi:hypothetical protein